MCFCLGESKLFQSPCDAALVSGDFLRGAVARIWSLPAVIL